MIYDNSNRSSNIRRPRNCHTHFLDALHVDYKATEASDDTAYLLSYAANAAHLQKSIEQAKNGEVVKLGLDDIWKP